MSLWTKLFGTEKEKSVLNLNKNFLNGRIDRYTYEMKLIDYEELEDKEKQKKRNRTDFFHGKIGEYDLALRNLNLENLSKKEYDIQKLQIRYDYGEVEHDEFCKELANLKQESYVKVDVNYNPKLNTSPFIEVDWNDVFINEIKDAGFNGANDEEIISAWIDAICVQIAAENESIIVADPNKHYKVKKDEGKTEYYG